MRVHHLNCGTFHPPGIGRGVCHVLLCETEAGLVLIDSGIGTDDLAHPVRMGPARFVLRPDKTPAETALRQVEARGFAASDVTHIVMTHLDFDHAGGLSDFPDAVVHTTVEEHAVAVTDPDFLDKRRYRPAQLAHAPRFEIHAGRGDEWKHGLTAHRIDALDAISMIPMAGHTRGHAAVAVEGGDGRTLIHAGDAAFDASVYAAQSPSGERLDRQRGLRAFEVVMGRDRGAIRRNHEALRVLDAQPDITVIPAHDARILDAMIG